MGKPHDYGEMKDIKEVRKLLTSPGAAFYVDMTAYGVRDAMATVNLLKAVFWS
jgi:hypothetical protein